MDAELKAKWVEALRSGEFSQHRGRLISRDGDAYCCIGVLCKIQNADFEEIEPMIVVHAGLTDGLTPVKLHDLADRNDGRSGYAEHSFSEIADYIEATL